MSIYNEGDSFSIRAKVYDEDGTATAPTTARYKIEDLTNVRNIRNWTDLTPASEMTIAIESDDLVILNERNRVERRQLQLQTNHGEADQKVGVFEFDVRNLQGT